MRAIAAVDERWGIGRGGKLLVRIPADQKFFRRQTLGQTVIVGRKTLETFPMGRPLEGRTNLVLTRNRSFSLRGEGVRVVHGLEELDALLEGLPEDEVWVIGGESVYRQLLPRCSEALLTRIDRAYEADAHFPDLGADPAWVKAAESEEQVYFDTTYRFERWTRTSSTRH